MKYPIQREGLDFYYIQPLDLADEHACLEFRQQAHKKAVDASMSDGKKEDSEREKSSIRP